MWMKKIRLLGYDNVADKLESLSSIIDIESLHEKELQSNLDLVLEDNTLEILKYIVYKYIYDTETNKRVAVYKIGKTSQIIKKMVEYKDDVISSIMLLTDSNNELRYVLKYALKNGMCEFKNKCLWSNGIHGFKLVTKGNRHCIKNIKTNEIYEETIFDDIINIGLDTHDMYIEYKDKIVSTLDKDLYEFIGVYNDCMSVYYKLSDGFMDLCKDETVIQKLERILAECLGGIIAEDIDSEEAIKILSDDELWKDILNKDETELGEFTNSLDLI